jgi:hypothetical protein
VAAVSAGIRVKGRVSSAHAVGSFVRVEFRVDDSTGYSIFGCDKTDLSLWVSPEEARRFFPGDAVELTVERLGGERP